MMVGIRFLVEHRVETCRTVSSLSLYLDSAAGSSTTTYSSRERPYFWAVQKWNMKLHGRAQIRHRLLKSMGRGSAYRGHRAGKRI